MEKSRASIIILTKNAGREFQKTLERVSKQRYKKNYEIIIIDSGSTDGTLEVIRQFITQSRFKNNRINVSLFQINPSEFGHGRTRNLGAKLAKGEYLVYLTQDAIPVNDVWLENITKPLKDEKIAGVYCKQVAKEGAPLTEQFFNETRYPNKTIVRALEENQNPELEDIFFSDVSSAIKKEIWKKFPFDDTIIMGEDQKWAKEVLLAGYKTIYVADTAVWHSHDYTLKQTFDRYYMSSLSLRITLGSRFYPLIRAQIIYHMRQLNFVVKKSPFSLPRVLLYNLAKVMGSLSGLLQFYLDSRWKSINNH